MPETIMMGETADISFICQFKWYEWIYYNDTTVQFPDQKVILGRYLGPTEPEVGSVLTAKILTSSGEIIRRNTLRSLTDQEINCDDNRKERNSFDEKVSKRLGEPFKEP